MHQIAESCHSARIYTDITDSWADSGHGVKLITDFYLKNPQLGFRNEMLKKGIVYYNDADALVINNPGMSVSEWEVQMGMWTLWASPLIMSNDFRNGTLKPEAKRILLNKEVLAIADDSLGLQATHCLDKSCAQGDILYG